MEPKFARIEKWANGLRIRNKKICTDELIYSLVAMLPEKELVGRMVKDSFDKFVEPVIKYGGDIEKVNEAFEMLLDRIDDKETDHELILLLLITMAEKLELSDVDPISFAKLLDKIQRQVNKEEREDVIKQAFVTFANRADKSWLLEIMAPYLKKQRIVKSSILPKNCILYQEELEGTKIVVLEVDKANRNVTYVHEECVFKNVGYPKLLFVFHVLNNRITRKEIMAVKDKVVKPSTEIYQYPFANVHFDSFITCWSDCPTEIRDLTNVVSLPQLWFDSPCNDHLYRGIKGFKSITEVFEHFQGKDFDDSLLESCGMTVGEYFEI